MVSYWVDIVIAVILLYFIASGFFKGFIKGVLTLISLVAVLIFSKMFYPAVVEVINATTSLRNVISSVISAKVLPLIDASGTSDGWLGAVNIFNISLGGKGNASSFWAMCQSSPLGFERCFVESATTLLLNTLAFVILFIALYVAASVLIEVLDILAKLPIINALNKVGGSVIGLIKGVICCVIFVTVLYILAMYTNNSFLSSGINNSMLAGYFYIGYLFI